MPVINNSHGKFFGPSQSYAGYVFIGVGIFAVSYSLATLLLIIPGAFLAFTYTGILIDSEKKRVRPYTNLFGIIRTGNWVDAHLFTRFSIEQTTRRYSSLSRGSVRLDMDFTDISLNLINHNGTRKVLINRFKRFEEARKEKEWLSGIFFPSAGINNQELIQAE